MHLFTACWFTVWSLLFSSTLRKNKWFNHEEKREKHKQYWNMFISKLGPKQRGRELAGWGEPLSSEALWNPGCQERWEEERGRGKSQEKVQVTLFFFLETNSGWTQGDARQFTKSQALLSHFSLSKACNLETGPQLTIASSSQTALFNLYKSGENPSVCLVLLLFWEENLCQFLTHKNERSLNNRSC